MSDEQHRKLSLLYPLKSDIIKESHREIPCYNQILHFHNKVFLSINVRLWCLICVIQRFHQLRKRHDKNIVNVQMAGWSLAKLYIIFSVRRRGVGNDKMWMAPGNWNWQDSEYFHMLTSIAVNHHFWQLVIEKKRCDH